MASLALPVFELTWEWWRISEPDHLRGLSSFQAGLTYITGQGHSKTLKSILLPYGSQGQMYCALRSLKSNVSYYFIIRKGETCTDAISSHLFLILRGKLCQQHQSRSPWWRASSLVRLFCPSLASLSTLADPCCWMLLTEPRPHHERQRARPRPSPRGSRGPSRLNPCPCRGPSPRSTTCSCPCPACPSVHYHPGRCVGTEEAAAVCQKQETGQQRQQPATEGSVLPKAQQPHTQGLHQPGGVEVSFTVTLCGGGCMSECWDLTQDQYQFIELKWLVD